MDNKEQSIWRKIGGTIVYYTAIVIVAVLLKLLMGFHLETDPRVKQWKKEKKAFVILSAHPSEADAAPLMVSIFPRRARVVTGERQLYRPGLGWIFRAADCIPKKQFMADMSSVRQMMATIKSGQILAMMPEGRVSFDSTPSPIDHSTAKLVKKLNVPVAALVNRGGYFVMPPYDHKHLKFGKIESKLSVIFDEGELTGLSTDEINQRIVNALSYNDSATVKAAGWKYGKNKNAMQGVSCLFYRCPNCDARHTISDDKQGNIFCSACGTQWRADRNMQLHPNREGLPEDIPGWNAFQKEREHSIWSDEGHRLVLDVKKSILAKLTDKDFEYHCTGTLALDRDGLQYHDEEEEFIIPLKEFTGVSADYMLGTITVFRPDRTLTFAFDDSRITAEFVNSLMMIRKLYV